MTFISSRICNIKSKKIIEYNRKKIIPHYVDKNYCIECCKEYGCSYNKNK